MHMNVGKAGIGLAVVFGGWHLCWSILVEAGWAQIVADCVFWMHFIQPVHVIEPFAIGLAAILVAVTAAVGFGAGFAWLWNAMHSGAERRMLG